MITHIIHRRIHILPTPPIRLFVLRIGITRHLEILLTHVLAVMTHVQPSIVLPALLSVVITVPALEVEHYVHLSSPEILVAHFEAHFVVIAVGGGLGFFGGVGPEIAVEKAGPSRSVYWAPVSSFGQSL